MKAKTFLAMLSGVMIGACIATAQASIERAIEPAPQCQQPPEVERMVALIERMPLKAVERVDEIGVLIGGMK